MTFSSPVPYDQTVTFQEALREARAKDEIPDTVLFLEHRPVVTLGNRGRTNHLLLDKEQLAERGIHLAHASRGGDVTYHGPGQLIMYPILKLGQAGEDTHGYLFNLEEIAVQTAASFGVEATRKKGKNGAWHKTGKIAAIGFRLKQWVSYHGMSFNVSVDLEGFQTIVPCGLVGDPVSSLKVILGENCPTIPQVRDAMAVTFSTVSGRPLEPLSEKTQGAEKILQSLENSGLSEHAPTY